MRNPFTNTSTEPIINGNPVRLSYCDVRKVQVKGTIVIEFGDGSNLLFTESCTEFNANANYFTITPSEPKSDT